ncbi:MAG: hypothetical protein QXW70_01200 [Candidatus Anstonellales archaeon]
MEEKKDEELEVQGRKGIASRGIPSHEAMYLPPHDSHHLRIFQDSNENITRNLWSLEEVLNFVFPKKYQQKYYACATSFISCLVSKCEMSGSDVNEFVRTSGVSKATFYNRVLPRLRRVGMIKVERKTVSSKESSRKYRPMIIRISKTFGNYLIKIGDSWLAIVDDARSRKDKLYESP